MPKKIGTILKDLLELAGVKTDDAKFKDILAIDKEMGDEETTALYDNLYNDYGVKNNDKFHKHFKKEIYDGLDGRLEATAKKFKLSDEEIVELKKVTNSFDRAEKLISILNDKSVAAIEAAKGGTSADKAALLEEIKKRDNDIVKIREGFEGEKKTLLSEFSEKQKNNIIENFLAGKSYDREDVPKQVHTLTAKTLINEDLKKKGAQMVMDVNGNLKLVQASNPDLAYTEQNKEVAWGDYADRILAENKLLKVSTPGSGGGNPTPNPVPPNPNLKPDLEAVSFYDQQLERAVA